MVITYNTDSVTVQDSYLLDTKQHIKSVLADIKADSRCPKEVLSRSDISLYREWKAHNRLYKWHLFRRHTKDVDLGYEPWYRRLCYFLLAF